MLLISAPMRVFFGASGDQEYALSFLSLTTIGTYLSESSNNITCYVLEAMYG